MRVSPNEEIRDMWDNKLPDFENEDQAQQFFDAIFSLWNGLVEINMAGNRLQLSQRHGLNNPDGLKAMIEKRYEELDAGFLSGFIGDTTVYDKQDPKTENCERKLMNLIDAIDDLQREFSDGNTSYEFTRKAFLKLDNSAQRILDNVVKAANAQRKLQQGSGVVH